MKQFPRFR